MCLPKNTVSQEQIFKNLLKNNNNKQINKSQINKVNHFKRKRVVHLKKRKEKEEI